MISDSPFAPYLGTNYCPSDEEVLKLNAFLSTALCLPTVEAHRALLSPARRLPLDVLQEIFVACMPSHRNCVMSAQETPVLLGRICSSWRDISLSTPRLWSRLHIAEPQDRESLSLKFAQRFENIKMWLGRSGECPLSISLYSDFQNRYLYRWSLVHALLPFTSRWQHIHFTTSPAMLKAVSHLTESDVPLLQTVKFHHDYRHNTSQHEDLALRQFGLLRSTRISNFSARENYFIDQTLPLLWHRLTVLEILPSPMRLLTSEKIIPIISRCPELRVCKLGVYHDGSAEQSSSHLVRVELKHLHTLEVNCQTVEIIISRLLRRLLLPQLLSLSLRGPSYGEHSPSLASLLARWQLEDLEISSDGFSKPSLLGGLRSLPDTMKRLVIHNVVLEMHNCFLISDAALLRLITSRMESASKLKRVQVTFTREMTVDILPPLQPFIKNGLDISVVHTSTQRFPVHFSPWEGLSDPSRF
ncbi:hypothetical protein B0H16DRAFT_1563008 [Mycena metata]|uniref:F-box domain-containing protein n=1 Tax=Mycena metata TaxID=1033252 RepID=A0AAD7IIC7_9AGAR|nr:hypothetical protein B0H16DRAFT_1563008 [Mycena metata]